MKTLLLLLALTIQTDKLDEICDSTAVWMQQRTGVKSEIKIKKRMKRGSTLDLYFTKTLSDYPWTGDDIKWFRNQMREAIPSGHKLGEIFCNSVKIGDLLEKYTVPDPRDPSPMVRRVGERRFQKGLDGRYIALWQSHGRYYDEYEGRWKWQRAPVHRTVEDLFTQTYVLPFLIPMLENAGAYVMSPRERDTQRSEIIIDNDHSFDDGRGPAVRTSGTFSRTGLWSNAGIGFADRKAVYSHTDNPFLMGTVCQSSCSGKKATSTASWDFVVPHRGNYAVYVSYRSIPQSSKDAHYTVTHLGGTTEFEVDQTRGGGTWIYLGNFEFDGSGSITLDNRGNTKYCVSADAVKIGGGMGKVDHGGGSSGVPSYCEGALYNMQWCGIDEKVWTKKDNDYANDYASRGPWVKYLKEEKHIPFDLSLAFHTDAGIRQNDSIVGTLAIYTLKSEGKRTFPSGQDRMVNRRLALIVQDEVVKDIRANFNPEWTRRETWDRSYHECRTPDVPAMLLELLSHQNFPDMKYGHDPAFKFTVSRAIYKGILKFFGEYYGAPYTVQPLPVRNFSVLPAEDGKALLSWEPTTDPAEKSAVPNGYTVYTRIDDGAFDTGREVKCTNVEVPVEKGKLYSFKIVAFNDGGRSFPSETLCYGDPEVPGGKRVLIVNNFNRISGPSFIEGGDIAGFNGREDNGVPYIEDLSYIGQVYDYDRGHEWVNDEEPGFGASFCDHATCKVAGNTFDYVSIHARTILSLGFPVSSCNVSRFVSATELASDLPAGTCSADGSFSPDGTITDKAEGVSCAAYDQLTQLSGTSAAAGSPEAGYGIIDLICGKEVEVWSDGLKEMVREATGTGVSMLVSGAYVATALKDDRTRFAEDVLGFRWITGHASPDGKLDSGMKIWNEPNESRYCVENPDALTTRSGSAALANGSVVLRYSSGMLPAAVHFTGHGYKAATYGFPLECLDSDKDFEKTLRSAIEFLK